jgi:hypothetical protein
MIQKFKKLTKIFFKYKIIKKVVGILGKGGNLFIFQFSSFNYQIKTIFFTKFHIIIQYAQSKSQFWSVKFQWVF